MMVNSKKILVSDYDQTFYINDQDIENNKKQVDKFRSNGNLFIIATGRSYYDIKKKIDIYNFNCDYLIINHGATILTKKNKIIKYYCINNDILKNIIKDLQIEQSEKYFCCDINDSRLDFNNKNLTKIYVKYKDEITAQEINEIIKEKYSLYVNCYLVSKCTIEIISNETDKCSAIEEVLKIENINFDNVYTIGDGYSDIKMITKFNGYCMENSVKDLIELCKNKKINSVSELLKMINN